MGPGRRADGKANSRCRSLVDGFVEEGRKGDRGIGSGRPLHFISFNGNIRGTWRLAVDRQVRLRFV